MRSFPEARFILPHDLPLVRRLASQGVSFDSATSLTRGPHTLEGALWNALPLTDLGMPTFVMRNGDNAYVAQFRHKSGEQHAHITFIAPDVNLYGESAWLALLDAMTMAAGRRGAFTLNAEVAETGVPFVILREAGFAVYARQEIWKREPRLISTDVTDVLRPATAQDSWAISSLYSSVVPRLVLQADALPEYGHGGLVYEENGQILGYLSIQEGKYGLYVQSLLHPDAYHQSRMIIAALLARLPRVERLPLYWPVRRYQEWLNGPLNDMGFDAWSSQAVMVKHTVYRLEQPALKMVYAKGMIPARTPVIDYIHNVNMPTP
ncbi:MAG: hypothetical protein ABI947_20710 [Chloroflexota bacterium]